MSIDAPQWQFVPRDLDPGDLPAVEGCFQKLLVRECATVAELEQWLRDESELHSRIAAELARRYIAMTCNTEDEQARQGYLAMEQQVMPRVKVLADRMDKKLLRCPLLDGLGRDYEVLLRQRRARSEIFREENTELEKREAELQTRQQSLMGSVTVDFQGRTHTLQQMAPYYESQDRELRRGAFEAALRARRRIWPELEGLFDELVELRDRMGRNAGFPTYTGFRFVELGRFDYDAADCRRFHDAVAAAVVPVVSRLNRQRAQKLGLDSLRPWDLDVDPGGRPPFRPFDSEASLIALARALFDRVDPRFAAEFDILVDNGLLDLMSRKGKAPGGYQYTLEDVRLPFIFANSVGLHHDVQTLLHEGGHAFHAILSRHHELLAYRDSPIEFAETASMSMELMGLENLAARYDREQAQAARRKHLERVLRDIPWFATIDAFQHWVYDHPGHSREQRAEAWLGIRRRFAPDIDYSGYEAALAHQWTGQTHLFNHAFYYIEYGIAQVAALQVWRNYRRDPEAAVQAYRRALALGGSRPLPELFEEAGVRFDWSEEMLRELVAEVEEAIA